MNAEERLLRLEASASREPIPTIQTYPGAAKMFAAMAEKEKRATVPSASRAEIQRLQLYPAADPGAEIRDPVDRI